MNQRYLVLKGKEPAIPASFLSYLQNSLQLDAISIYFYFSLSQTSQRCPHLLPRIKTTLTTPPKIDKCRVLHARVPGLSEGRVSTPSLDHFAKFSSQNAHVAFGSSWGCNVGDRGMVDVSECSSEKEPWIARIESLKAKTPLREQTSWVVVSLWHRSWYLRQLKVWQKSQAP